MDRDQNKRSKYEKTARRCGLSGLFPSDLFDRLVDQKSLVKVLEVAGLASALHDSVQGIDHSIDIGFGGKQV